MRKRILLMLAAAALLAGCGDGENFFDKAYDGARTAAGIVSDAAPSVASEAAKGAGDAVTDFAREMGIMTPDEILGSARDLLNPSQNASEGSNSAQTGSGGQLANQDPKDAPRGGNSADRGVYDVAFAERHENGELTEVELCRVVDGDTIVTCLEGSYSYVRLIGINTPESVAPDDYLEKTGKKNTQEGKDASTHSKEILTGVKTIWLEFDAQEYDPYERILAYAWLSSDRTEILNMLNARILYDGYAEPMSIAPNVRYAQELAALADDGR